MSRWGRGLPPPAAPAAFPPIGVPVGPSRRGGGPTASQWDGAATGQRRGGGPVGDGRRQRDGSSRAAGAVVPETR